MRDPVYHPVIEASCYHGTVTGSGSGSGRGRGRGRGGGRGSGSGSGSGSRVYEVRGQVACMLVGVWRGGGRGDIFYMQLHLSICMYLSIYMYLVVSRPWPWNRPLRNSPSYPPPPSSKSPPPEVRTPWPFITSAAQSPR